jgi:phytoene dehydrogenase-like protein
LSRVLIVGGGISGLTASVYALIKGHEVTLLEKNNQCGGLVNSFERAGFIFDGGVPSLLDSGIIKPMLREIGVNIDFIKSKVSVGLEDKIIHVKSFENLEDYAQMLKLIYPENSTEIDAFMLDVRKVMKVISALYALDNPLFVDIKRKIKNYLPWLFKLPKVLMAINRLRMPIERHIEGIISNRSLRDVITQHFFKGTPSFFALGYFFCLY